MSLFKCKAAIIAATLAGALLGSGCAASHDVVALTGTVEAVGNVPDSGTYHIYKIRRHDNSLVEVPAFANVTTGTCVDVLVSARKAKAQPEWAASDITLRQTNTCPARDALAQSEAAQPSH
jgi:hypothetical protein